MDSQQSDSTGSPHASEPSFSPDDIMDLRLDPSDPLNYLLNSTQREDSSADGSFSGSNDSGSLVDWSDLSSMLPPPPGLDSDGQLDKYYDMDMNMDLENFSLSNILDMNFDPSTMSVDPSALHFNPPPQNGLDQSHFPFTFQPKAETVPTQPGSVQSRRLSITSSSSSSGASLSPIMDSQMVYPSNNASLPTPPALMPQPPLPPHVASEDPSIAMAQRVLQAAGVMHAVPMSAQYSHLPQNPGAGTPAIPRFTAHPAPSVGCSSASSTPPPQTPPSGAMATGRTKTSHTTIERRYRTNLNARILSLRNAVPALRFLEDREPKKPSMTTPVNDVPNTNPVVLDEKGLADGVKPPRKLSKANVLLKATEYILVLKRREKRLSRSQDSLKALLGGLVGGQVLVDEWEREWRRMWGDVLDDPSEGIYSEANLMGLGMAEDDEDEDSGDEETGGKRKRARVEAAPRVRKEKAPPAQQASTIVVNADGSTSVVVPEKRKRGRPRKNPLPPQAAETAPPQPTKAEVVPTPRASGTQQFLFATFALFSFFNNGPLANYTMPKQHHAHSGVVLTAHPLAADVPPPNLTWVPTTHELIGYFHLLVSVLVFASFFWPAISAFFGGKVSAVGRAGDKQVLSAALDQSQRGKEDEAQNIRDALTGSSVKGVWDLVTGWLPGHGDDHKAKKSGKFEQLGLEQRAWVRLGEICVLRGETNVFTRLSTYVHLRLHLAWFTATAADLSTLALILYPCSFGRAMARSIWRAALKSQTGAPDRVAYRRRLSVSGNAVAVQVRAHERLVLETLDVDSAFEKLACAGAGSSRLAPIGVLASVLVKERVKAHLAAAFVRAVLGEGEGDEDDPRELRRTVEACRSLGGEMRALGDLLERVVESEGETVCEESLRWAGGGAGDVEKDIRTFLSAIARYRRITMSGSVVRTDEYELRKALGDVVFDAAIETSPRLEEARDQVVEMLWKQRTNGGRRVRYAQA
ncbi:hypothetical protein BD626DRAFT_211136 [Schizophyllum amplum]|uniref:BHLH domain-containing protein n=1 Tax=Schizophyllum amplum TaxID=97359 RepID=A0A550BY12_9AGAR|nr:hypothetical protein BD626DRAFT_211136 [Auriculariopsis ampla]